MGNIDTIANFINLGIMVRAGIKQQKTKCPKCSETRTDKRDKSLSVNLDNGVFRCHYCGYSGTVNKTEDKKYVIPEPSKNDMLSEELVDFFRKRGISRETLREAGVSQEEKWISKIDRKTDCIVFNYREHGRLVNKKYRSIDVKRFALEPGAKLVFYNIDSVI